MLKKLWKKWGPNPLESYLNQAEKKGWKTFLLPWNRGLGDIALGLFAIVHRIRERIPDASITFLTRSDLLQGFSLLKGVRVIEMPEWKRGLPYALPKDLSPYDCILENADPTHWVSWQRGKLTPRLEWHSEWDSLHTRFSLPDRCIGIHVSCETNYYHARNWPEENFRALFASLKEPLVLFGLNKSPLFSGENIYDLRGEMNLYEMLSIIQHKCKTLIAPDSGVLSMAYYLNKPFPLKVISLWADPNHGILKQNVPSPNPLLTHTPIISSNQKNASLISVEQVREALCL